MSLPAIRSIRQIFPHAHLAVVARPWVADLYARESSIDRVIPYTAQKGFAAKRDFAARFAANTSMPPFSCRTPSMRRCSPGWPGFRNASGTTATRAGCC